MNPTKHARLSASAAERWVNCPGSVDLAARFPNRSSSYARRGTALHEYAHKVQLYGVGPATVTVEGEVYTLDDHDREGVRVYLDYIETIAGDADWTGTELALNLDTVDPDLGGISDFCAVRHSTLWVVDFKAGSGVTVFPEGNLQLLQYGLGVYNTISPQLRQEIDTVKLVIVQPWAAYGDVIKVWETDPAELIELTVRLQEAAERTRVERDLQPGEWCRWCPAQSVCPALKAEFEDLPVIKDQAILRASELTLEEIGSVLVRLELLEPWLKEVYKRGLQLAEAGAKVPGMKLVPKRAMRRWKSEEAFALRTAMLDKGYPMPAEKLYQPPKLKSPAMLEEDIGKKEFARVLGDQVLKVSSGNNLVLDQDAVKGPDLTPLLPSPSILGLE